MVNISTPSTGSLLLLVVPALNIRLDENYPGTWYLVPRNQGTVLHILVFSVGHFSRSTTWYFSTVVRTYCEYVRTPGTNVSN